MARRRLVSDAAARGVRIAAGLARRDREASNAAAVERAPAVPIVAIRGRVLRVVAEGRRSWVEPLLRGILISEASRCCLFWGEAWGGDTP